MRLREKSMYNIFSPLLYYLNPIKTTFLYMGLLSMGYTYESSQKKSRNYPDWLMDTIDQYKGN